MLTVTFPNISAFKFQLVTVLLFYTLVVSPVSLAQITLDGTLGRSGALSGPDFAIKAEYGQQHGGHLFHSFGQFNLDLGQSATFSGPNSVNNIISRVTGGNPSRINGLLRSTIPNANLYFLNPYGILFGEGAGLDVQGSFHASTADTLRFSDGREFNARVPEQPLLTVAPVSAFGFLTDTPAAISLQDSHLSVSEGKTLSLIGGDLRMSGSALPIYDAENDDLVFSSTISAESGRLNFASLASRGEIVTNEFGLNLSAGMQGGQIVANNTQLDVNGEGGGSIFIRGGRFELNNSNITAETFGNKDGGTIDVQVDNLELQASDISSVTIDSGKGGAILIKVSDALNLSGLPIFDVSGPKEGFGSRIFSSSGGIGKAGNIEIEAREITLEDDAQIGSGTFGTGEGGSTILKVTDTLTLQSGRIFADTVSQEPNAGNAGNIEIEARQMTLENDAQISSGTFGHGEGGSISVKADTLMLQSDGIVANHTESNEPNAGNAGHIEIEARQMTLLDGAQISSSTFGSGKGGTIVIKIEALTVSGSKETENFVWSSGIFSNSDSNKANAGKAGNIAIEAVQITLTDGADISTSTQGGGQGGNIVIKAEGILKISGTDKYYFPSGIRAESHSRESYAGKGGSIEIEADQIQLYDGAQIGSGTFGHGEGGVIIIKVVGTLTISGESETGFSGIFVRSDSMETNAGKAGNIEIEAGHIMLTEGAEINNTTYNGEGGTITLTVNNMVLADNALIDSTTFGSGKGGIIVIKVADTLNISGGAIYTNSESTEVNAGNAGYLEIEVRQITLEKAQIGSGTLGPGKGGTIVIKVTDTLTAQSSGILGNSESKETNAGKGGSIEIEADQIRLYGAQIGSNTFGSGEGGTIVIKVAKALTISSSKGTENVASGSGIFSGIFSSSDSNKANAGKAGNITIGARQVTLTGGANISTSTQGGGKGGNIFIKVDDILKISGTDKYDFPSGIKADSQSRGIYAGKAGSIEIEADQIQLFDGAQIGSGTFNSGEGGTIDIKVAEALTISGSKETENGVWSSGIFGSSQSNKANAGKAGNIAIGARQITLTEGATISTSTQGGGKGGNIVIKAEDILILGTRHKDGLPSSIGTGSQNLESYAGKAGSIEIEADQIQLSDGAQIGSGTFGPGEGGTIIIHGVDVLTISGRPESNVTSGVFGSSASTEVNAGKAGDIEVQVNTIKLTEEGTITTYANNADGGNITVNTSNLLYLRDSEIGTNVTGGLGDGGNINIDQPQFTVLDNGRIIADAHGGDGGNIHIVAEQFIRTPDSRVTASSRLGIDGNVQIDAPETRIGDEMVVLPKQFAGLPLPDWCDTQLSDDKESSRFVVNLNQVGMPRDELRGGVLGSYLDITTQR